MITDTIRLSVENSVLCWLATVDGTGAPNVTPKEIFSCSGDDRIVVADIASSNTVQNIRDHPLVCVSFIDVFRQKGFKIVGTARIVAPDDEEFPRVGGTLFKMAGDTYPIRNIIVISVDRVSPIWAPSYRIRPNLTETERMKQAFDTYGVIPANR